MEYLYEIVDTKLFCMATIIIDVIIYAHVLRLEWKIRAQIGDVN